MHPTVVFKVKEIDSENQFNEFEILFMNADVFLEQLKCLKPEGEIE